MRHILAAAVAAIAIVAAIAAAGNPAQADDALKPPVIHESFTPLGCPAHPVATLDREGCYEQTILKTDRKIDAQVKTIFGLLAHHDARLSLVRGEHFWLRYRNASCFAESFKYFGGTEMSVLHAACAADRNKVHLTELVATRRTLSVP